MRGTRQRAVWAPVLVAAISVFAAAAQTPPPASPQRTILDQRVIRNAPGDRNKAPEPQAEAASGRTIDSILQSTEDLNTIRDGYLRRLAGDGCPPDVAMRVADLRARLHDDGSRSSAAPMAGAGAAQPRQTGADLEGSLLILAAKWYEPPPAASAAPALAARDAERARLLELVLSPKEPQPAANSADAVQMKAELDRLLVGCRAGR